MARVGKLNKKEAPAYVKTLLEDYPKGLGIYTIATAISWSLEEVTKLLSIMVANNKLVSYELDGKEYYKLP